MKRRGRPFNHSPEFSTRQSDFRERLREMKMLSADEDSPVMEPAAGSVFPGLARAKLQELPE